jgi:hypothetical protein
MENKMIEQNTYCGKKFTYKGKEFIRIDGIWFEWDNNHYKVYKSDKLETVYKEQFGDN